MGALFKHSTLLMNPTSRYNILIFGPQGSGKGTQAQMLSSVLKIPTISPGAMYRQIKQEDSEFAQFITHYLDQGKLVPDKYTNRLVVKRVRMPDCKNGFILDGYPRNKMQMDFLCDKKISIDHVINVVIPDEEGIRRISERKVCPQGHSYHPIYAPPKILDTCDIDGLALYKRSDETKEAITKRLEIYHRETEPLIAFLRTQGVNVLTIDGVPSIQEVNEKIKDALHLSVNNLGFLSHDNLQIT